MRFATEVRICAEIHVWWTFRFPHAKLRYASVEQPYEQAESTPIALKRESLAMTAFAGHAALTATTGKGFNSVSTGEHYRFASHDLPPIKLQEQPCLYLT